MAECVMLRCKIRKSNVLTIIKMFTMQNFDTLSQGKINNSKLKVKYRRKLEKGLIFDNLNYNETCQHKKLDNKLTKKHHAICCIR